MSVFSQFKNFLRTGSRTSSCSGEGDVPKNKYEAAARMAVQEENLAKQRMPCYAGLERYKLEAKLGDGAFSKVYSAKDLETGETVAVKAVHKQELTQTQKNSVLKEAQIMRTMDHPSIVKLRRFIETKEFYFLILDICKGGELFHRIVRLTYFSEDLARHCIRQVAEGIRYLHEEKGVVHRDIKPENLLFEPIPFMERTSPPPPCPDDEDEPKEDEGEFVEGVGGGGVGLIKIADFGLSKVVWDQHTMTPCGTVGYTAPEIVRDERYSKSVDMWALGCVLYTLLCGFPPFYDESIDVLTEKVARGYYTFLSPWWDHISEEAKDLVSHLLCINPKERYTIDQFLEHPWVTNKTSHHGEQTAPEQYITKDTPAMLVPPSTTTSVAKETIAATIPQSIPIEKRRGTFSSGLSSMKEVFDVSYAVHRMAEERTHQQEQRRRSQQGFAFMGQLGNVAESEDEEGSQDDAETLETDVTSSGVLSAGSQGVHELQMDALRTTLGQTSLQNPSSLGRQLQQLQCERAVQEQRQRSHKKSAPRSVFDLNMDNATLLGRRRNNLPQNTHTPLVRTSMDA